VGAGICAPNQITLESDRSLRASDLVLHHVGRLPEMLDYLGSLGVPLHDLEDLYEEGALDIDVYDRIANAVLDAAEGRSLVTFVVNGHPLIYNRPVRLVASRAKARGISVNVLPGISSIDTMLLQVGIEIGSAGLQIYDCNRFVYFGIEPETTAPLLLFQPGCFGSGVITKRHENLPARFAKLVDYLLRSYPPEHEVRILKSALTPASGALDLRVPLGSLCGHATDIDYATTLYLAPLRRAQIVDRAFFDTLTDAAGAAALVASAGA
jgi:uncharacterized protein YabN with tetrapyrrole methylase and pyrophosphatase domain